MSVIPVLIVIGLVVAGGFLAAFLWALNTGQFDDATTPAWRILNDESPADEDPKPAKH